MNLALFDLDNTLLAGDSDFEWAQFLIEQGVLDREVYEAHNAFMRERGLGEERRLYSHSQGYDLVERPLVRHDDARTRTLLRYSVVKSRALPQA